MSYLWYNSCMPKGLRGFQPGELNPSFNPERREQIRREKLGRITSEEQKKKISASMKKALQDPALREKWRRAATGRVFTEETKEKIRMTKASKPRNVKQLKAKLDTVFSIYIRVRDSVESGDGRMGVCITCKNPVGATGQRTGQAGHFVSRRFNSTRYDEQNVHLQCARCNMWGAGEQYLYSLEVDKLYGAGTAEKLHQKSREVKKFTTTELLEMIQTYRQKTADLLQ